MSSKGYTSATKVAAELGRDLTAPQLDQCADLIAEAEDYIDRQTGRAWLATSPVTDELHSLTSSPLVYLQNKPVTAVTSARVRPLYVGGADTSLVAGSGYELIDPANGVLLINGGYGADGALLKVTYTTTTPVPGDIQRAATLLVASWMTAALEPDQRGVESYSLGSDLSVKFRADAAAVPDEVERILCAREVIAFA